MAATLHARLHLRHGFTPAHCSCRAAAFSRSGSYLAQVALGFPPHPGSSGFLLRLAQVPSLPCGFPIPSNRPCVTFSSERAICFAGNFV